MSNGERERSPRRYKPETHRQCHLCKANRAITAARDVEMPPARLSSTNSHGVSNSKPRGRSSSSSKSHLISRACGQSSPWVLEALGRGAAGGRPILARARRRPPLGRTGAGAARGRQPKAHASAQLDRGLEPRSMGPWRRELQDHLSAKPGGDDLESPALLHEQPLEQVCDSKTRQLGSQRGDTCPRSRLGRQGRTFGSSAWGPCQSKSA